MHQRVMGKTLGAALLGVALAQPVGAGDATFAVDSEAGNNTFNAVFDAAIGERITAVSSAVGCTITADEEKGMGRAQCSVPLPSIKVDSDDVKTEHFQQWATNKKTDPQKCVFELDIPNVKLPAPLEAKKPVAFSTEGTFTVCGRKRDTGQPEKVQGTIIYLPSGAYGDEKVYRIRARIEGFDREQYGVSPKNTAGWLARVQQLANVVATEGTIDVNLFAYPKESATADASTAMTMKKQE